MWEAKTEAVNERTHHYKIVLRDQELDFATVIESWQSDAEFREFFSQLLAESPFAGFRWETPQLTRETMDRPFEFVLLQCDQLQRTIDRRSFANHFSKTEPVVTFANLGRNAVLVVPCPVESADVSYYGHLASFMRGAPAAQVHGLWQSVGAAMQRRIGEKPVWLSTAGMGVSWLHVRLDDRPKYYGYKPFKA